MSVPGSRPDITDRAQRSVLLRVLGRMSGHDRMGGRCRTNRAPSRLALCATGSAGFSTLTLLRWPGSLLPCDQGLLCAIALTLQAKGYCASRGWEIVADYVEPGASGTRVGSAPAR